MWIDLQSLESRLMLAAVPVVKGWWEGTYQNSLGESGQLTVKFKQDGKQLSGSAVDDDGIKYKLAGRIDKEGQIRLTLKARGAFDGTVRATVRSGGEVIKGRYSGDSPEGSVFGTFRIRKE